MFNYDEHFRKFSAKDMHKMWRTLKAEMGSHPVVRPYPGVETHQLKYWMDRMEERLAEEIASRPSVWKQLLLKIKRRLKWI